MSSDIIENDPFTHSDEFLPYYRIQENLKLKVETQDRLPDTIRYVAGTDVAYSDVSNRMVGAIVVLDAQTLDVVDEAYHEMEIAFPYVPGLFSFREIPAVAEAYNKLKIKPDLIVCDAQGIAHPKGVGMATHLGLELNVPTIGCAKKKLLGSYDKDKLGNKRGDAQDLVWDNQIVGRVLRTQDGTNPVFVSIGHRVSLDTAQEWALKLTPNYRLPETTRHADHLVNSLLKNMSIDAK